MKNRTHPTCLHERSCGGCQTRHLNYEEQLLWKQAEAKKVFSGQDSIWNPPIAAQRIENWRSKVQLPIAWQDSDRINPGYRKPLKELAIGCYAAQSHRVVNQQECHVQSEAALSLLNTIRAWIKKNKLTAWDEVNCSGGLRYVVLRENLNAEILVGIVTSSQSILSEQRIWNDLWNDLQTTANQENFGVVGLVQHVNDHPGNFALNGKDLLRCGQDFVDFQLGPLVFPIQIGTFFQIHLEQAQKMFEFVQSWIAPNENVLDLYCGTGAIGMWLAQAGHKVCGLERNPKAIESAQISARRNQLSNTEWICGDIELGLKDLGQNADLASWGTWVVDPPRKGLSNDLLRAITDETGPKTLIYISCQISSLARDHLILDQNYELVQLQGIDLFPHTEHLEVLALYRRKTSSNAMR